MSSIAVALQVMVAAYTAMTAEPDLLMLPVSTSVSVLLQLRCTITSLAHFYFQHICSMSITWTSLPAAFCLRIRHLVRPAGRCYRLRRRMYLSLRLNCHSFRLRSPNCMNGCITICRYCCLRYAFFVETIAFVTLPCRCCIFPRASVHCESGSAIQRYFLLFPRISFVAIRFF